jgi:hypothetical protein
MEGASIHMNKVCDIERGYERFPSDRDATYAKCENGQLISKATCELKKERRGMEIGKAMLNILSTVDYEQYHWLSAEPICSRPGTVQKIKRMMRLDSDSNDDCEQECKEHPGCIFWMLFPQKKQCRLYQAGTKPIPKRLLNLVPNGQCTPPTKVALNSWEQLECNKLVCAMGEEYVNNLWWVPNKINGQSVAKMGISDKSGGKIVCPDS